MRCSQYTSCSACASDPACGYCNGVCRAGSADGPLSDGCLGRWIFTAGVCRGTSASQSCRDGTYECGGYCPTDGQVCCNNVGRPDLVCEANTTCVSDGSASSGVSCQRVSSDSGGSGDITAACVRAVQGLTAECGWHFAGTYDCTPGTAVVLGCTGGSATTCSVRIGSCEGDPMIRVCSGYSQCSANSRVQSTIGGEDDYSGCGTCPLGQFTCPSVGQLSVYDRPFGPASASCTFGRR